MEVGQGFDEGVGFLGGVHVGGFLVAGCGFQKEEGGNLLGAAGFFLGGFSGAFFGGFSGGFGGFCHGFFGGGFLGGEGGAGWRCVGGLGWSGCWGGGGVFAGFSKGEEGVGGDDEEGG